MVFFFQEETTEEPLYHQQFAQPKKYNNATIVLLYNKATQYI